MGAKSLESISKTQVETQVLGLCEELLEPQGFRVVDLDCRIASRSLVRLFIERVAGATAASDKPGSTGATLDDCAEASRLIGGVLETKEELIPGGFDLEVSSAGLDRRLRTEADFRAVVGETVKLKLTAAIQGLGANVTGELVRVESAGIVVSVSKK